MRGWALATGRVAIAEASTVRSRLLGRRGFSSEAKAAEAVAQSTTTSAPERGNKRTARSGPRFEATRTFLKAMGFVAACGFGVYAIRRAYFHFRPEGNDRAITMRLQDEMRLRPHWAASLVYTVAHHALCDSKDPFGSPLVCSPEHEDNIREVLKLLRELQIQHPGTSLPDLWCAATTYAVASLGGPLIPVVWGRYEEEFPVDPVKVAQPVIQSTTRDVSLLKKVMMQQSLAPDEIVALLGHRTLGCHSNGCDFQMGLLARASQEMLETKKFVVYDSAPTEAHPGFSSETPGVFDHDYFVTLSAPGWTRTDASPAAATKKSSWVASKNTKTDVSSNSPLALNPEKHPHVRMEPLDLAIKEDSLMAAWVLKFAENEVRFFNSFERAASRIMRQGWEGSKLRDR